MALGVLTVALLALVSTFVAGTRLSAASTNVTVSTGVGRELLETIIRKGYSSTVVGTFDGRNPDPTVPAPISPPADFPPAPYPESVVDHHHYRVVVDCQQYSATSRSVRVDVYWDDQGKTTLKTLIHQ